MKNTISFNDYKNCLLDANSRSIYSLQLMFRNNKHEIHTAEVNKVALSRNDDKQIVKKDEISTLACGHNSFGWNYLLGFISLSYSLVMVSLQDYLIISWMLSSHNQTSILTLF